MGDVLQIKMPDTAEMIGREIDRGDAGLREAGRMLREQKANLSHGEWLPWLEANMANGKLRFKSVSTADRLMKFSASAEFDDLWYHNTRGTTGTGDNEWFTPPEYIRLARLVLGDIDLDPATHLAAQRFIKAKRFFTKERDGLKRRWTGRVWLNPPYAQPLIGHFVAKLIASVHDSVTAAIMLTHNYTDTNWFRSAWMEASAVCFTDDRIKFIGIDGELAAPTQGQAFFYFGPDHYRFIEEFSSVGFIAVRP